MIFFVDNATTLTDVDAGSEAIYLGEETYNDVKLYWTNIESLRVIRALKANKSEAEGVDGLTSNLILRALPCLLPMITHIFNHCLSYGVYPELWKTTTICPIPKVRYPADLRDYRPISILCCVSKALERIVADQIRDYLKRRDLLDPCQAAYKRGSSTQTALIRVMDDVRQAADARKVTIAVFFDFTKAFDNVRHHILIEKLRHLGFSCSALRWLCAYLVNRRQAVRDPASHELSSFRTLAAGVPQGSVLGPLLFTLYLLDFNKVLGNCKYNFYADDLLVYLHSEPRYLTDAIRQINTDIQGIVEWTTSNGLVLNPKKTTAMVLGTARYINSISYNGLPNITVNETVIPFSDHTEYLGLTISSTLSWEKQVSKTTSRVFASVHQLKICKHLLPLSLRILLIKTLVLPLFDYCSTVLTDITGEQNLRLQRALNACIRFIYQVRWDEHITPFFERLRWLKIHSRRLFFVGNLTFSILHTKEPPALYSGFEFRDSGTSRATRASNDTLILPQCRTEFYKRSFICTAAEFWNRLPPSIRNATSLNEFRGRLFEYLLRSFP